MQGIAGRGRPAPHLRARGRGVTRLVRYLILGAGAVGSAIGGRLTAAGRDVVLIARGAHLEALQRDGLRLREPERDETIPVTAVDSPAAAEPRPGDVAIL